MSALLVRYIAALALSTVLVPICRALASRYGYVAAPRADRWHATPTPLLGGAAIAVSALLLSIVFGGAARAVAPVILGGGALFVIGLVDDVLPLKPSTKLIAEIAVASLLLGFFPDRLHWSSWQLADTMLTLVWLVGITNAVNLLDNMDGLCAGVSIIAGTSLLISLYSHAGSVPETQYLALLLGATTGFLLYNIYPASIFMGDAGSLFLGFSMGALTLSAGGPGHERTNVLSVVTAPVLIMLIPILDTALVTVSRVLGGRRVSQGGRDHSSHRLVAIGLSEAAAVGVLWTLAAVAGLIGYGMRQFSGNWAWLAVAMFVLSVIVFAVYLAQVRVYPDAAAAPVGRVTPVLVNFMYKRRVAEVLLDVCLVSGAYYGAWVMRFDGPSWAEYYPRLLQSLPLVVAIQLTSLFVIGAYRGDWRYFGLMDGVVFAKSVMMGTALNIVAVLYLYGFRNYSRVVFVDYAALLMLMLCASRASFRLMGEFAHRRRAGLRVVICGAGQQGALVLRDFIQDPNSPYRMLGFVDDDAGKRNLRLQGYPVLGGVPRLFELLENDGVDVVILAAHDFDPAQLRTLTACCKSRNVRLLRFQYNLEDLVSYA